MEIVTAASGSETPSFSARFPPLTASTTTFVPVAEEVL